MKQYWQRIALKIDALTLRERVIIFAMAALVLITLVNATLLDPFFKQQKALSQQIRQDQAKTAEIQAQIQQQVSMQAVDPDAANRELLGKLVQQSRQMQGELNDLQKGLVSADKMPTLLEGILQRQGKLRLVSLKTRAPTDLVEGKADAAGSPKAGNAAQGQAKLEGEGTPVAAVYKHGVEIIVQGSYLDMVSYLAELEAMSWQLFWAKAQLEAREYPKVQLTLVLYTLSLEKRWLNI